MLKITYSLYLCLCPHPKHNGGPPKTPLLVHTAPPSNQLDMKTSYQNIPISSVKNVISCHLLLCSVCSSRWLWQNTTWCVLKSSQVLVCACILCIGNMEKFYSDDYSSKGNMVCIYKSKFIFSLDSSWFWVLDLCNQLIYYRDHMSNLAIWHIWISCSGFGIFFVLLWYSLQHCNDQHFILLSVCPWVLIKQTLKITFNVKSLAKESSQELIQETSIKDHHYSWTCYKCTGKDKGKFSSYLLR